MSSLIKYNKCNVFAINGSNPVADLYTQARDWRYYCWFAHQDNVHLALLDNGHLCLIKTAHKERFAPHLFN